MNGLEHLAERLEQIAEELDEIAFDQLREAVADGEVSRPSSDKTLMQARRAVMKAARLLGSDQEL
jgi:Mg2+ and Co2+ transporter CorA